MKKFLVILLSFIFVFFSCFVSFADSSFLFLSSHAYDMSILNSADFSPSYTFIDYGLINGNQYYGNIYLDTTYSEGSIDNDSYCFFVSENGGYSLVLAIDGSISTGDKYVYRMSWSYNGGGGYNITPSNRTYDADNNITYYVPVRTWTGTPTIPVYSSVDAGLTALRSFISASAYVGAETTINVSAGNLAYIGLAGGRATFTVPTSNKFSNSYNSNIRLSTAQTIPSIGSTITVDSSFGSPLSFTAVQPFDVLGRSNVGQFHMDNLGIEYLVVYNPIYDNDGNVNPTVSIHVTDLFTVVQYPLTASVVNGNLTSSGSPTTFYIAMDSDVDSNGNFDYIYYTVDANDEQVTSSAITVPAGGNNSIDVSTDDSIGGLLDTILSIFKAPINYISNLFNSGSTFMSWLSCLFGWLPDPVQSVITSALIVLIVVGVIKFLWK